MASMATKTLAFPVHIVPEETGYYVTCPILPGCHSQGETLEEAKANIREAIELVIEDMAEQGEQIPDASHVLSTTVTVEV
jgi:predicted RNase H-like HicB family nuclease